MTCQFMPLISFKKIKIKILKTFENCSQKLVFESCLKKKNSLAKFEFWNSLHTHQRQIISTCIFKDKSFFVYGPGY